MSPVTAATIAALIAGVAAALQATLLGILGRQVGVLAATSVGAATGAILVFGANLVANRDMAGIVAGFRQPLWLWLLPGVLGAVVVTTITFAPPRIGVFGTFALLIGGQLLASVLVDSLGLFGVDRVPLSVTRVAGLALVLAGALLVLRR